MTGAATPADAVEIPASRTMAWLTLGFGWICAQSLLTLIPIAPAPWGVMGLVFGGGIFVVVALVGLARVLGGGAGLVLDRNGLTVGGTPVAWVDVEGWRLREGGARVFEVELAAPAARRLPWRVRLAFARPAPRCLRYRAGDLRASLTEVAAAFRDVAPGLERPA